MEFNRKIHETNNRKYVMWSKNTAKMLVKGIFAVILRNVKH